MHHTPFIPGIEMEGRQQCGEYTIYRTVVDTADYPSGRGEFITGMHGKEESLGLFLNMLGHVHATGVVAAATLVAIRRQLHNQIQIAPRLGRQFNLHDRIPIDSLKNKDSLFSDVDHSLMTENFPKKADVWIVSSMDTRVLKKTGFLSDDDGPAFVCFSEKDAKKLICSIKELRKTHLAMLEFQPIKINNHCEDKLLDRHISLDLMQCMLVIFTSFKDELGKYIRKYQDEPGTLITPILGFELAYVTKLSKLMDSAIHADLDGPTFSLLIDQINVELHALTLDLQAYLKLHPYVAPEFSFPVSLLHQLAEVNHFIPDVVARQMALAKLVNEQKAISAERSGALGVFASSVVPQKVNVR